MCDPRCDPLRRASSSSASSPARSAVAAIDIERTFHLSDPQLGFLLATGIIAATAVAAIGGIITDRWGAGVTLARALIVLGLAPRRRGDRSAHRGVRPRVHARGRGGRARRRRDQRHRRGRARARARSARALPRVVERRVRARRDSDRHRDPPRRVVASGVGGDRGRGDRRRPPHVPGAGARTGARRASVDAARA